MNRSEQGWSIEEFRDEIGNLANWASSGSDDILLLPQRYDEALPERSVFRINAPTVRSLLREQGLSSKLAIKQDAPLYQDNRSASWIGPALLFAWPLYASHPNAVAIALNLISSHIYEVLSDLRPAAEAQFECLIEDRRTGIYKRIKYSGPVSGLKNAENILESFRANDNE